MIKWSDGCSLAAISHFTSGKDPSIHFHNCLSSSELLGCWSLSQLSLRDSGHQSITEPSVLACSQITITNQTQTSKRKASSHEFSFTYFLPVLMFYLRVKENTRERIFWTIQPQPATPTGLPPCIRMYSKLIRSVYEGSWLDASQTSTSHFSPLSKYQSQLFQSGWDQISDRCISTSPA